jgi:hypothetical protein
MKPETLLLTTNLVVLGWPIATLAGKGLAEKDVPPAVVSAFKAEYPKAKGIVYGSKSVKDATWYEIDFKVDGVAHEVVFNAEGNMLSIEKAIK